SEWLGLTTEDHKACLSSKRVVGADVFTKRNVLRQIEQVVELEIGADVDGCEISVLDSFSSVISEFPGVLALHPTQYSAPVVHRAAEGAGTPATTDRKSDRTSGD